MTGLTSGSGVIRPESLSRIEQGRVSPAVRTIEKIDEALKKAERAVLV